MEVLFVTGNSRKVWQAQEALKLFGITVVNQDCEVQEIQSHDATEISIAKAKSAFELLKKPVVINDHYWEIPALGGFPGGYMKDVNHWFTAEDFLSLLAGKTDRTGILTENVVYYDGQEAKHFAAKFQGKFINEARGTGHVPSERVFIYDGRDSTIAECVDRGEHARDINKSAWKLFGEWYGQKDV